MARLGNADATIDVTDEMAALTLAIVGETLFSSNVQGDADEVREALTAAVQSFGIAFLPGLEYFEKLPLPMFVRVRKARERLDRVIHRVIQDRRNESPQDAPHDLVSMLLAARDPENPSSPGMSDQQIRDEAMTIFLAGHETTANAMAWTWHLLGPHRQIERRLHDELSRVLDGRTPSVEDVPKLELTRDDHRRIDAPLSPGLDDGATRDRAAHDQRSHHRARRAGDRQPVDCASRQAVVDRSRHVQSGSMVGEERSAEVRLLPVWRRLAHLHRRIVRVDRGDPAAGDDCAAVVVRAGDAAGDGAAHHAQAERPEHARAITLIAYGGWRPGGTRRLVACSNA